MPKFGTLHAAFVSSGHCSSCRLYLSTAEFIPTGPRPDLFPMNSCGADTLGETACGVAARPGCGHRRDNLPCGAYGKSLLSDVPQQLGHGTRGGRPAGSGRLTESWLRDA